ncbi:MAG: murein biosynthesis integral membrane protein MurJ [Bdellovibrionales bacterium]|nr:murein biosynthesis integral membrane protein MurJ [Bdellovibrionales bacterium]MBT3525615.1 murein biosynthesis integral membrane protein MurJ [Bdellovibrionales bacterium]
MDHLETKRKNTISLLLSSLKMAVATLLSRILGLVREQVMAYMFGASGVTDAFLVAYRIPNMLRDLFAEGAFSAAFVPIFTEVRLKDPAQARRMLWTLVILLGFITLCIVAGMIYFAPELVSVFAPRFVENPEKFQITVTLIRLMSPFLTLVSLAALMMGVLNSIKIFFVPSLAPALYNIVMIASMVLLPQLLVSYNLHIAISMGIGVVLGGVVQLAVQLPLIFLRGYGPTGPLNFSSVNIRRIINRVGVGTIGIAATQINILINTVLATSTVVGAVSWLSYGFRLFQFPVGILGVSIAGSNLVHFSELWKKGDYGQAKETLRNSYAISFAVMLPALALLFALSNETIHLIYERGRFSSHDTMMAAKAMRYYLVGLPFYGLYKIFSPTFYALDMPRVPVTISVISIVLNITFSVVMTPIYGFHMLALGISISMMFNTSLQSWYLRKVLALPVTFFINRQLGKVVVSSVATLFLAKWLAISWFSFSDPFLQKVLIFSVIGILGAACYLGAMVALGEWKTVKPLLIKRKRQ